MAYQIIGNSMITSDVGVILPTYGEAENISKLIDDIENLKLDASILVIDDSSPDGTAGIVQKKQSQYPNIILHVRPKKTGLGTAITDGFKIFLSAEKPPKYVLTMDADYSHNPQDIPKLLATMTESDCGIVIGSRYVKGGRIAGWPFTRKIISKTANLIARTSLGLKLKDCTSGYRCYSTEFLKEAIGNLHSHTYEIQIETVRQAALRKFNVKETPILFVNRKRGKSKLSWTEIKSYLSYTMKAVWRS
ncbi:MAG: polyprenol monophosphomannose synthase [Candidatus Bathyarchaeota archaeon]|nr:polyprenol monophosphomannose synthase [Candidatus Bathyarchaeota archaeon]